MAENEPAIAEVTRMLNTGMQNEEIIAILQERGYSNETIQSALTLANTKASVENQGRMQNQEALARMIEPPAPGMRPSMLSGGDSGIIPPPPTQPTFGTASQTMMQSPSAMITSSMRDVEEKVEEIAEAIIEEKWSRVREEVGDLRAWKEKVTTDLMGTKQEILRVQSRLEAVQNAVLGRVKEYDKSIEDVGADIKAIEMLLKNILDPLSTSVKELKAITDKLKR